MPEDALRAAIQAEIDEPGSVTKAELRQVLRDNPPDPPVLDGGRFADTRFDPARFD